MQRRHRTDNREKNILIKHIHYYLFVGTVALSAFAVDLRLELGIAGAVLYLAVVAATYFAPRDRFPREVALACTALTVIGFLVSPPGGEQWKVLANRGLSLFAIWVTATLVIRARASRRLLANHTEKLETLVRKRTAELSNSNLALERSNEALQQFAYIASHDLKTPLRAISGFVQLLKKKHGGQLDDEADRWIKYMIDNTERLHSMIEDILDYSQVDGRGRPFQPASMNELFDHATEGLATAISDSSGSVTRTDLPVVEGDAPQLMQLLQNLIDNGLKYHSDEPPTVEVTAERVNGNWQFAVRDNGRGIDARHHERIFEIFKRLHTQDEIPGTGIGLAISRKVVHRHGGRIWLESEPEKGSTFYFTIPERTPTDD